MKFFGHPIHPMVIHFPTALLPADLVLSSLHFYRNDDVFGHAAFFCLAGGVVLGLMAAVTGLLDLLQIDKHNKQAIATGLIHGFMNGIIILVFGIFAYKSWQNYPSVAAPAMSQLVIKTILVLTLFVGNYMGGKLIYKYRVGIEQE